MEETVGSFGEGLVYGRNFGREGERGTRLVGVGGHRVEEPVVVGGAHGAHYGVP